MIGFVVVLACGACVWTLQEDGSGGKTGRVSSMNGFRGKRAKTSMRYRTLNPLPIARRLRTIAQEEGTRAAVGRIATYGRLRLARSGLGQAVGYGQKPRSVYAMAPVWSGLARAGVFFADPPERLDGHLAILAETSLPQCTKYRVNQMAVLARACGLGVTIADHRDQAAALSALQLASHVMFYRLEPGHRAWMYLYEARRLGLPVLYDIDDPLFSIPALTGSSAALPPALVNHFADAAPGILAMMSACDAISVSTPALAGIAARLSARPVFLRRNFADAETLAEPAPVEAAAGLTVAMASGSDGRAGDLGGLLPVLDAFLSAVPSRRLHLVGHGFPPLAGLPMRLSGQVSLFPFEPYDRHRLRLAAADAILVPLADDTFNACKSAVRAIDAAAVARPVIASPVGDLGQMVVHGETGWLAATPQSWAHALDLLAALPDRGRMLGRAARARLEAGWADPLHEQVTAPGLRDWLAT